MAKGNLRNPLINQLQIINLPTFQMKAMPMKSSQLHLNVILNIPNTFITHSQNLC